MTNIKPFAKYNNQNLCIIDSFHWGLTRKPGPQVTCSTPERLVHPQQLWPGSVGEPRSASLTSISLSEQLPQKSFLRYMCGCSVWSGSLYDPVREILLWRKLYKGAFLIIHGARFRFVPRCSGTEKIPPPSSSVRAVDRLCIAACTVEQILSELEMVLITRRYRWKWVCRFFFFFYCFLQNFDRYTKVFAPIRRPSLKWCQLF